jgi:hypothetical protein
MAPGKIQENRVGRLATGWTVPGSNAGGARYFLFSIPIQTGPGADATSPTVGTRARSREQNRRGVALRTHPI